MNPTLPSQDELEPSPSPGAPDNEASEADEPSMPNELCVPIETLAMPDEQDAMQPPAVGDKLQASVELTVTRVENDNAYVSVDALNGHKLEAPAAEPSEDEQMGQLQDMAQGMPGQPGVT